MMAISRADKWFGEMCIPELSDVNLTANFAALDWNQVRTAWSISMFSTLLESYEELPGITIGKTDEKLVPSDNKPLFGTHIREAINLIKGRP